MRNVEMNTVATVNTTEVKATATSYIPESINGLAREVQKMTARLRKVTNPWDPKATELTESDISKTLIDCELQFKNLMTGLVEKAGYKVEDEIDEMFLGIFINTISGIGTDFSDVKKLAFQKFEDENPNWEEEADKPEEPDEDDDDDDEEYDEDEVIVIA